MTAPAHRVVPPPTPEQIERRAAERELLISRVEAHPKTLIEITTIYGYELDTPVELPGYPGRLFVYLDVEVTRYPGATAEAKRPGAITATGYHRQRTDSGRPRVQQSPGRPARLPDELALPLIARALTQA
jgi:hypothetical protein